MSFPGFTSSDLIGWLPEGAEQVVTEAEAQNTIDEWTARVVEKIGQDVAGSSTTAGVIVKRGSWGEMEKLALTRKGQIQTPSADALISGAERLLGSLPAAPDSTSDDPDTPVITIERRRW